MQVVLKTTYSLYTHKNNNSNINTTYSRILYTITPIYLRNKKIINFLPKFFFFFLYKIFYLLSTYIRHKNTYQLNL